MDEGEGQAGGSGVIMRLRRTTGQPGSIVQEAPTACFAAAAGTTSLGAAGRPRATSTGPTTATSTWASASPGLFPLALEPLDPWQIVSPESAVKGANRCRSDSRQRMSDRNGAMGELGSRGF